jgi:hypothetical protein
MTFPGSIPNSFDFELNLDLFPPFLIPDPLPVVVTLSLGSQCGGTPCYTSVRADNSLYMSIPGGYTSQNGYAYLGAPGPSAVPEPSTVILTAAGLALLIAVRRLSVRKPACSRVI